MGILYCMSNENSSEATTNSCVESSDVKPTKRTAAKAAAASGSRQSIVGGGGNAAYAISFVGFENDEQWSLLAV